MTGHSSKGNLMEDYCDGKVFKSHPLFSCHRESLQIHFYYDDVEFCNPLGSKAKIHKLGKPHNYGCVCVCVCVCACGIFMIDHV